jgi:tight adherence protein C
MVNEALPLALMVFFLSLAGATALYRGLFGQGRVNEDRLLEPGYHHLDDSSSEILLAPANSDGFAAGVLDAMTRRFGMKTGQTPSQRLVANTLTHAGFRGSNKLIIFRLIQLSATIVCGAAGACAGSLLGNLTLQTALFFAALGYFLPIRILRRMARYRQVRVIRELPATLDLLVVCIEAGLGLVEALRLVSQRSERRGNVLGAELGVMSGELSTGVSLSDGLHNLSERVGAEELKSVAALVIQSEQMGSRLAPALRASADQFATRRRMRAEEKAQKAAVKMLGPLVVLILPAMLIVVLGPAILRIITTIAA